MSAWFLDSELSTCCYKYNSYIVAWVWNLSYYTQVQGKADDKC